MLINLYWNYNCFYFSILVFLQERAKVYLQSVSLWHLSINKSKDKTYLIQLMNTYKFFERIPPRTWSGRNTGCCNQNGKNKKENVEEFHIRNFLFFFLLTEEGRKHKFCECQLVDWCIMERRIGL